jgi:short-subunit dehydrogenase
VCTHPWQFSAYAASKHATQAWSQAVAHELRAWGIHVSLPVGDAEARALSGEAAKDVVIGPVPCLWGVRV